MVIGDAFHCGAKRREDARPILEETAAKALDFGDLVHPSSTAVCHVLRIPTSEAEDRRLVLTVLKSHQSLPHFSVVSAIGADQTCVARVPITV